MSLPCALHGSPKYCGRWSLNGSLQGRQVSADGLPPQRLCFRRHQVLSRFVVEKDLPVRADCHDSSRTAFDKNIQLLRSEEHTSELQSRRDLVCRLLLEKKKKKQSQISVRRNTAT